MNDLPVTTLFMLESLDGKINSGNNFLVYMLLDHFHSFKEYLKNEQNFLLTDNDN